MAAKWCVVCGKPESELSSSTHYLPLGIPARVLGWLLIVAIVVAMLHHPGEVLSFLLSCLLWLGSHLFGITRCDVLQIMSRLLTWVLFLTAISLFLPERYGQAMRQGMVRLLVRVPMVLWRVVRSIGSLLWRIAEGEGKSGTPKKHSGK